MSLLESSPRLLTTRLRDETREAHERVEAALNPLTEQASLTGYAEMLSRWRAFFVCWEPLVHGLAPDQAIAEELISRSKIGWIDQDLAAIDAQRDRIVFEAERLPVNDWADALGGIYVIEGATLGGQVLCKRFGEALGLTPERGLRYFNSYGSKTAECWRETKHLLNDARWANQHDRIIRSAPATFAALTDFFSTPLPFRTI